MNTNPRTIALPVQSATTLARLALTAWRREVDTAREARAGLLRALATAGEVSRRSRRNS